METVSGLTSWRGMGTRVKEKVNKESERGGRRRRETDKVNVSGFVFVLIGLVVD